MAALQVILAFPVIILLIVNLIMGMFTFYFAVKLKISCNYTTDEVTSTPVSSMRVIERYSYVNIFNDVHLLGGT